MARRPTVVITGLPSGKKGFAAGSALVHGFQFETKKRMGKREESKDTLACARPG